MNFRQAAAGYIVGAFSTEDLPLIAYNALLKGLDSPSLVILAGMSANDTFYDLTHYFKLALKEIGIAIPSKRDACIIYALSIADDIFSEKIDLAKGASKMYYEAINRFDFNSETQRYAYDSIGFEQVYSLLMEYEDTLDSWPINETLQQEIINELSVALRKWYNEMTQNFKF
ncbi:hypothetical protein C8P68_101147 [Mucilaginibacter yixingensis]|uniref:Uncharacterized protein n=1 Tax=Mucilaginibacter yixingensis TaxID=1295612 RepID=A0A2T5JEQ1_9SPHI|nr:hypothetical protein [Mucilaginibacter yixingensis]PTR00918.1 hypothetical protein C8P68_101147 [Mucilaginibacter yixingensis]